MGNYPLRLKARKEGSRKKEDPELKTGRKYVQSLTPTWISSFLYASNSRRTADGIIAAAVVIPSAPRCNFGRRLG